MRAHSTDGLCMSLFSFLKRISPIILLACYSLFGGWLFTYLEGPSVDRDILTLNDTGLVETFEEPMREVKTDWEKVYKEISDNLTLIYKMYHAKRNDEDLLRMNLTNRLWQVKKVYKQQVPSNLLQQIWNNYDMKRHRFDYLLEDLIKLQNYSIEKFSERVEPDSNPWNLWSGTLYAATLYTTIGYGNIYPKTTNGRIATMLYALFGIPLVLAILNDFGQILFNALKWSHSYFKRCVQRRKAWTPVNGPQEVTDLSITAAIVLLISWICVSAAIFLIWEDWDYFTAFYFFFITLTTIGLGDVVPEHPSYALMAFLLVLFGLSVVSMSINIIQAKVENSFNNMIKNIDNEYRQKQIDPSASNMNDSYSGGMGIMRMFKNKPWKERILLNLMGDHKKQMLEEHWEQKARTRNVECQTEEKKYATVDLQVDLDDDSSLPSSLRGRPRPFKVKNSYIYNLGD